ncbi:MAG: hypothetical protein HY695_31745 [Deltaproteobacteria bacterium]|nr:hypothetical protein [Deltaproteobacteria bacterium]
MVREIESGNIPVAHVTPMAALAKQMKSNRIVVGTKIPHPCGDPSLPVEADHALRREIVTTALEAIQTEVNGPTIFEPEIAYMSG